MAGQLLTPLTRYANAGCEQFAIDNGAFSGFNEKDFLSLLKRESKNIERCLWVSCVDIVGSARRTLELWKRMRCLLGDFPAALVAQDGIEDLEIPWDEIAAIFIGGKDPWKDSECAKDIVRTAKILRVPSHVGRVNTIKRYKVFAELGADTCDGSGVAMYDHMLRKIQDTLSEKQQPTLF